jgi:hypothetical protein
MPGLVQPFPHGAYAEMADRLADRGPLNFGHPHQGNDMTEFDYIVVGAGLRVAHRIATASVLARWADALVPPTTASEPYLQRHRHCLPSGRHDADGCGGHHRAPAYQS